MYSLTISGFNLDKETEDLTLQAIKSYRYYFDEIIYSEDGGIFSPLIMSQCTSYIYNYGNKGFTYNVNRAWRYAKGDFVAMVSNDTHLVEGDPRELCIKGKVTSPEIVNQNIEMLAGMFFVVPKEIKESRGYLLEELITYCSDSEYDHRVRDIFKRVPTVKVWHKQATTVKKVGKEGGKEMEKDRATYERLIREGRAAH